MRTRLFCIFFLLMCPQPARAITLGEFEAQIKADNPASLNAKAQQVIATGSPEFMVRASRLLIPHLQYASTRMMLLKHAAVVRPKSYVQRFWTAQSQYDLAMEYIKQIPQAGVESKARLLLEAAVTNNHKAAPTALASLLDDDPTRAEALYRLGIARGDPLAEAAFAAFKHKHPSRKIIQLP